MSTQARSVSLLIALSSFACTVVKAESNDDWKTTISVGSSFGTTRQLQDGTTGLIANMGTLDPSLAGDAGFTTLNRISTHDAFTAGPAVSLELSKLIDSSLEPFFRVRYTDLKGRDAMIGSINHIGGTTAPILANFDDLKSTAFDVGTRYSFAESSRLRPFIGGYVGVTHTNALETSLAVNSPQYSADNLTLVPSNTRFDTGVEAGIGVQLNSVSELNLSVGANYLDAKNTQSNAFQPLGIGQVSITDPRWSIPANIGVSLHF